VTTDSDELACHEEQVIKNFGTIQLRYRRGTKYGKSDTIGTFDTSQPRLIHEKVKKAQLSHQTAFGKAKPIPELISFPTCDWIDSKTSPFFQIEFRYRSRRESQYLAADRSLV
jgi:hypothetical protein